MKKKFVSEAPFFSLNYSTTIELERYWCLGNFHGSSEFSRFFGWKPRKPRNSSYPPVTLFDIEVEASISVHVFPCHFTIRKSNKKSSVANRTLWTWTSWRSMLPRAMPNVGHRNQPSKQVEQPHGRVKKWPRFSFGFLKPANSRNSWDTAVHFSSRTYHVGEDTDRSA